LPWRSTSDPYAIWISEVMLQQTRVEAVIPYWRRFLGRFPTVSDLARAREEEVLAAWSGLGYYSRARSLHEAARLLCRDHGAELPRSAAELRELPGVGGYTAGAVASIAFDAPEPLVDGNVARVLSRLFRIEDEVKSAAGRRALAAFAGALVPRSGGAGAWNQALMELGATVCLPRAPQCGNCPLASLCAARAEGLQQELPRMAPRTEAIAVRVVALIVREGERCLLVQRPEGGRMASMWELPTRESAAARDRTHLFPAHFPRPAGSSRRRVPLAVGARLGGLRHGITRHRIEVEVREGQWSSKEPPSRPYAYVARGELPGLATTGMTRKICAAFAL
jgi:A/G-specific adenine glycosylase